MPQPVNGKADLKFGFRCLFFFQVEAGNGLGICTAAVLSGMNSTIGRCVGNSVEVIESLETLKGNGPDDLMELVTTQGDDVAQQRSSVRV